MTRRSHLFLLTVAVLAIGFVAGRFLFQPALKFFFAGLIGKMTASSADETAAAIGRFNLALGLLSFMVPFSALVTERFAVQAKYSHALVKSFLVGLLAFGAALLYQHEQFASRERLAAKMPQLVGEIVMRLGENPLTKIVWFTAACLVIFGPLDLWIAHLQKQWRKAPEETAAEEKKG